MRIYKEEIFGPVLSVVRPKNTTRPWRSQRPRIWQRGRHLHPRRRRGARLRVKSSGRHGGDQCADPGAARLLYLRWMEAFGFRRPQSARSRFDTLLHEDQDGDVALAVRREGRRKLHHTGDVRKVPLRFQSVRFVHQNRMSIDPFDLKLG